MLAPCLAQADHTDRLHGVRACVRVHACSSSVGQATAPQPITFEDTLPAGLTFLAVTTKPANSELTVTCWGLSLCVEFKLGVVRPWLARAVPACDSNNQRGVHSKLGMLLCMCLPCDRFANPRQASQSSVPSRADLCCGNNAALWVHAATCTQAVGVDGRVKITCVTPQTLAAGSSLYVPAMRLSERLPGPCTASKHTAP
jgi:hypothetical protein